MKKICSVILAVVMVASLFLMSACGGAKEPTKFDSPQARYEYVADKEVKKIAEPVLTQYSEATENVNGKKISAQITVEFGKDLKELLTSTLLSVDLESLKSIGVDVTTNGNKQYRSVKGSVLVNGKSAADAELFADTETGKIIAKIPVLFDGYMLLVEADGEESDAGEGISDYVTSAPAILNALPSQEELNALILKYSAVFFKKASSVTEEDVEYAIGSLKENAKAIKVSYTSQELEDFLIETMQSVKTDETVKSIVEKIGKAAGAEDAYSNFIAEIDEALAEAEDGIESVDDGSIEFVLYTNDKNEILGIELTLNYVEEVRDYDENYNYTEIKTPVKASVKAGYLETKDQYAFILSVNKDEEAVVAVSSEGTKSGNAITGPVSFAYGDLALDLNVKNLDVEALKKGTFSGEISVSLSALLGEASGEEEEEEESVLSKLSSCDITVKGKASASNVDLQLSIKSADADFLTVTVKLSTSGSEKISIPSETTPAEDVLSDEEVFDKAVSNIEDNLKKAGVSEDLIAMLSGLVVGMFG